MTQVIQQQIIFSKTMEDIKDTEEIATEVEKIKLIIPLATYRKIMAYVTICDTEISGFAEVEYNPERNVFVAGEVYLCEQEASGASVHMTEETVSKFNLERIKAGATQLPRLWWHSHVNMQAFFSAIDEDTLKDLQNDTFTIALVANKSKEMKAKAYIYNETTTNIMGLKFESKEQIEIDPLPLTIELEYERIPETLKKEVEKKVKAQIHVFDRKQSRLPYKNPMIFNDKDKSKSSIVKHLQLPKDPLAAQKRIDELGLVKEWDTSLRQYIYKDPYTHQVWVDYWQTLEQYDNENFLGDDDDFRKN